jgi:TRAP-type C4-dicarboxylate transport system substrate-binding protein
MFKALGAVPVTMIAHEAYEGLKRGMLDAVFFTWALSYSFKLHEVARYVSDVNFGAIVGYMTFINLNLWNSWPQGLRDLCQQIGLEAEKLSTEIVAESDRQALESMLADGAELVSFQEQDKLEKALPDTITLVQERVAKVDAKYEAPARAYANFLRAELAK